MKSLLVVSSGKDLASRGSARRLRASLVVGEPVSLDFAGVRTLTQSFADELIGVLVARQEVENWIEECLYAMVPGEGVLCDFAQSLLEMELGNIDAEQIAHEWVNQGVVEGK